MVDEQIVNWIKENLSKGYSIEQIKPLLLQRYSEIDVMDALLIALKPGAASKFKISKKMIWSTIISLGVAILLLSLFYYSPSPDVPITLAPLETITTPPQGIDGMALVNNATKNNSNGGVINISTIPLEMVNASGK